MIEAEWWCEVPEGRRGTRAGPAATAASRRITLRCAAAAVNDMVARALAVAGANVELALAPETAGAPRAVLAPVLLRQEAPTVQHGGERTPHSEVGWRELLEYWAYMWAVSCQRPPSGCTRAVRILGIYVDRLHKQF